MLVAGDDDESFDCVEKQSEVVHLSCQDDEKEIKDRIISVLC